LLERVSIHSAAATLINWHLEIAVVRLVTLISLVVCAATKLVFCQIDLLDDLLDLFILLGYRLAIVAHSFRFAELVCASSRQLSIRVEVFFKDDRVFVSRFASLRIHRRVGLVNALLLGNVHTFLVAGGEEACLLLWTSL
jgi:hypothetical protein